MTDYTEVFNYVAPEKPKPTIRMADDFYPTPHAATAALFKVAGHLFRDGHVIFEPCAGHGAIADSIRQIKPTLRTFTNEPFPVENFPPDYSFDASIAQNWVDARIKMIDKQNKDIDWVITNPPYTKELQLPILQNSYKFALHGLAALVRLSWMEPCSDRRNFLKENADQLRHVIILNPRPKYRSDTKGSDNVTSCWMIWNKDWSWREKSIKCPFQFLWTDEEGGR